ncbi:MAG: hypothetical protein ACFWUJ_14520 [Pseudomonas fragi]
MPAFCAGCRRQGDCRLTPGRAPARHRPPAALVQGSPQGTKRRHLYQPPLPASDTPNDWTLVLSRRITAPDGKFGGVAVALMKLSYFHNLFRGLDLGPTGNISLVSTEASC